MNRLLIISALVATASADGPVHHGFGYTPTTVPYGYKPVAHSPAPYHPDIHAPVPHHAPHVPHHPAPYIPHHPPSHPAPLTAPHHVPVLPLPHNPNPHHPPHHAPHHGPQPYHDPLCAKGNPRPWCLEDPEYPSYEIQKAIEYHYDAVQQMFKDVLANTENSVDRLREIVQETYLCPSETAYIQPLRALNVHGKWRVIVNHVDHYKTLTQTARIEECTTPGDACPLVPECYATKCLQKFIYHRFLVYDPYDQTLPFAIDIFKLPSACACHNGDYIPPHA